MATYEIGNLTERLVLQVFGLLVLALRDVDWDELVRNLLFLQDDGNAARAGGHMETVKLEDHVGW